MTTKSKSHLGPAWRGNGVLFPVHEAHKAKNAAVSVCSAGGAHRWRIETPHDGLRRLEGVCRKCGAQRGDFVAGEGSMSWSDERDGELGPRNWNDRGRYSTAAGREESE